ncbi:hypothetical protein [Neptuniibacter sp.]|uniref:hypothetical protein n=1 Tax=Neptuniibacter sp. TaxID=1962643 RepID=UPI00261DCAE2|nr:hypothetical protein [Neptuniibacter sp.]MCP4597779.1 hypothetical protein [Neptuniibacter sp.]
MKLDFDTITAMIVSALIGFCLAAGVLSTNQGFLSDFGLDDILLLFAAVAAAVSAALSFLVAKRQYLLLKTQRAEELEVIVIGYLSAYKDKWNTLQAGSMSMAQSFPRSCLAPTGGIIEEHFRPVVRLNISDPATEISEYYSRHHELDLAMRKLIRVYPHFEELQKEIDRAMRESVNVRLSINSEVLIDSSLALGAFRNGEKVYQEAADKIGPLTDRFVAVIISAHEAFEKIDHS